MKNRITGIATCCLLLLNICSITNAQNNQINIVSFTVKNILPATIDNWVSAPGALILTAQKTPALRVKDPRLIIQIRGNGAIICGNTVETSKPLDPFDIRTFNTADLTGFLSNCHELKDGTYSICAQFFNGDKIAISREVCKEFKVEAAAVDYSPPTLTTPDNGKKFTQQELQGLVMFRWTPLVPKPKEPVTYRLRVWQLMQGQNGNQAVKSNTPVVTKEVENLTQTAVTGVITGPCKPPYLCDFIWNVQATGRNGKPMGKNNGLSEAFTFSATETTKCPNNKFPEDKKQFTLAEAKGTVTFKWSPVVPNAGETNTYRLRVWQLMQGQQPQTAMKSNQPVVTKDVLNNSEVSVTGVITGPCRPPYMCDFIWSVERIAADGHTICSTEPTTFSVASEITRCSNNVFPEDKKQFTLAEAKGAITFKWSPVVPNAGETNTYRLRVWQLMQGQQPQTAMKSNQPVVTKDVLNNSEVSVTGVITGPCRPPYMCDFIWSVELVGKDGHTTCISEPTTFKISNNDIDIQIDSVYIGCCGSNGMQNVYIKIKNNLANTVKITQLNIDKVNGFTNVIPITGLSPVLPVNITGLGSQAFTGTIKCIDSAKTIRFFVRAEDASDNAITETEVETDTLNCPCDPCRLMAAVVENDSLKIPKNGNPTQINLAGTFSGLNPNLIKKVTAEIIYFSIQQTKDTNCAKCVFDSKNYGNFYPPASPLPGFNGPVFNKPDYSRLVTWNSTIIKDCGGQPHDNGGAENGDPTLSRISTNLTIERQTPKRDFGDKTMAPGINNPQPAPALPNFILPIAVPEMNSLSCCGDVIKICIRYTFYDFCCHACEVIKCYEIKREK